MSTPDIKQSFNDIQGNILGGFNKDHQRFLFFRIDDARKAKAWLHALAPTLTSTTTVFATKKLIDDAKAANQKEESLNLNDSWTNLALNYPALETLGASGHHQLPEVFREGMAARSARLGDTGPSAPAEWDPWLRQRDHLHILLILGADQPAALATMLTAYTPAKLANAGVTLMHTQAGEAPPGKAKPNEHFGFRDGISQPGLRGITPSTIPPPNDHTAPQGIPGQDLLHPGEFVLGYPTQTPARPNPPWDGPNGIPGPISTAGPAWTVNGSFLVFRKLQQDVAGFRNSIRSNATALGFTDPEVLGAKIVGRFRSGCPMQQSKAPLPGIPDTNLGDPSGTFPAMLTDAQINNFEYGGDLPGDFVPRAGHIRKAYPRDEQPLLPIAPPTEDEIQVDLHESDTQTHRILRRGIPFGPYMDDAPGLAGTYTEDGISRGLLFLAYQHDIANQFEFIQKAWVNNPDFPNAGDGVDPVLAQVKTAPLTCPFHPPAAPTTHDLRHYVTTNGGEYFFQPSIPALKQLTH